MRLANKYGKETKQLAQTILDGSRPISIRAEGENKTSVQDDADQHAKAYWFGGFTWEETEAVLEDMGYSEPVVNKAINHAVQYAAEVLNDGPFKPLKEGQLIQLTNGSVVPLIARHGQTVSVRGSDGVAIQVNAKQIDMTASKMFKKAFLLRQAAKKLFKVAQKELTLVPGAPIQPPTPGMPTRYEEKTTPEQRAPGGWKPHMPERLTDVPELESAATTVINQIEDLNSKIKELEEERKIAKSLLDEVKTKTTGLSAERQEAVKTAYGIISAGAQTAQNVQDVLVRRLNDKLVAILGEVQSTSKPVGLKAKHGYLMEILQEKFPEVYGEIMKDLELYEEAYTDITEEYVPQLAIVKPTRKQLEKLNSKEAQDVWSKFKGWVSGLWGKIKDAWQNFTAVTLPKAEALDAELGEILNDLDTEQTEVETLAALNHVLRK